MLINLHVHASLHKPFSFILDHENIPNTQELSNNNNNNFI